MGKEAQLQKKRKKFEAAGGRSAAAAAKKTGGGRGGFWKKSREKSISAQQSIPYQEMGRDGICRVRDGYYSKTIQFYDVNYQLGATRSHTNTILQGEKLCGRLDRIVLKMGASCNLWKQQLML